MTRHITRGQDNWAYRSGYKRSPSVSGPIEPMDTPAWPAVLYVIKGGLLLAGLFVVVTLLLVAGG